MSLESLPGRPGRVTFNVEFPVVELFGQRITLNTQEQRGFVEGIFKEPAFRILLTPARAANFPYWTKHTLADGRTAAWLPESFYQSIPDPALKTQVWAVRIKDDDTLEGVDDGAPA